MQRAARRPALVGWTISISRHFENSWETIDCSHLKGNHNSRDFRWCRILSIHSTWMFMAKLVIKRLAALDIGPPTTSFTPLKGRDLIRSG